jgi:prepilin-type N-terminal cleavage/methylation domain-containing protein
MPVERAPSRRYPRGARGGTLLEVLISLAIVSLLMVVVLEVSAHTRDTRSDLDRQQIGRALFLEWRAARANGTAWAQGSMGHFPAPESVHWNLGPAQFQNDASSTIDSEGSAWIRVELVRDQAPSEVLWQTPVYAPELQPTTAPATENADDQAGGAP